MTLKLKLGLNISGLLLIILFMLGVTWYTTAAQKSDARIINLAGRQRMLSQMVIKELLLFSASEAPHSTALSGRIRKQLEVFHTTLVAITDSGMAPVSLDPDGECVPCPKAKEPAYSQLKRVYRIWQNFSSAVSGVLDEPATFRERLAYIKKINMSVLAEMDRAVSMMQTLSENKLSDLVMFQGACALVSFILILICLFQIRALLRDLTDSNRDASEKETQLQAKHEELRLAHRAMDTAGEAIMITDNKGTIIDVNPAFLDVTGFTRGEVIGQKPSITKSGRHDDSFYAGMWQDLINEGKWEGEIWDRKKTGEIYPKWLSISAIRDGQGDATHYVGLAQDISRQKQAEKDLQDLAFYDPLTKLPNRTLFRNRLSHAIEMAKREAGRLAVLFIDLDHFKYINDSLGHTFGDDLLQQVASRLQVLLRKSDTVARLGGDEFTIILSMPELMGNIATVAEKILASIKAPYNLKGKKVFMDASIGIAFYPDDARSVEELVRSADLAMYRAKELGRGRFSFFTRQMDELIANRQALASDLHQALAGDQFVLHYQPKIDLAKGTMAGMEALIRWQHPEKGLIPPMEFIPIAEETGFILPLGEWVLKTACAQTKAWRDSGHPELCVAVNLSAKQFQEPGLPEKIGTILKGTGLPPEALELELTETVVMEDAPKAQKVIQAIAAMGISVSVDDFGTGYSSLSYLKLLPLKALKIDRAFIRDLEFDNDDKAIVSAVISLAKALRLSVVAEGVEDGVQLGFLKEKKCEIAQGYHYSKPLDPEAFSQFLEEWKP